MALLIGVVAVLRALPRVRVGAQVRLGPVRVATDVRIDGDRRRGHGMQEEE